MLVKSVKYLEVKEIPHFFFLPLYTLFGLLPFTSTSKEINLDFVVSQSTDNGSCLDPMIQLKLFLLNARVSQTEWLTWSSSYLIYSAATL